MSKKHKWVKVTTIDEIKVGDKVKQVEYGVESRFYVGSTERNHVYDIPGFGWNFDNGTWYVRRPKKAKDDLVDGHNAKHWYSRWQKQLTHNEQLQIANKNRRIKMQQLEKQAKEARQDVQYWESKYANLAASIETTKEPLETVEPVMPEEPPVGTFFRVDRTGIVYQRVSDFVLGYRKITPMATSGWAWDSIVQPGDTITMLELTEVGEK